MNSLLRSGATFLVLLAAAMAPSFAQGPVRMGDVRPYQTESPHPYPLGTDARPTVWEQTISSPGATFIRVHFVGMSLAEGDFVSVSSPDGEQSWTYAGRGPHGNGNFWSFAIEGEEVVVRIHGGRQGGFGVRVDAVGHGTQPLGPTPEVTCGNDGREDVACHMSDAGFDSAQRPVARLLFISGPFLYACTGWLVDGQLPDMLMTNNHCISTQGETDTVQATFNFQCKSCGCGDGNLPTTDYPGGTLLKTNNVDKRGQKEGLDYTLMTLQNNPEGTWGKLEPSSTEPGLGEQIWLIQHGGGNEKTVGYYEDSFGGAVCDVDAVGQTYGRSAQGSQVAYACDTEGGSSGSPVISAATQEVIALHHFGGVDNCLNSGTAMADICADAGSLLNCGTTGGGGGGGGGSCAADLLPKGASCSSDSECCSGSCKGKPDAKTCK